MDVPFITCSPALPLGTSGLCHGMGVDNGGAHCHQHHHGCHHSHYHPEPNLWPGHPGSDGCIHLPGGGGSLVRSIGE